MGIRDTMNQKPGITTAVMAVIIVVAIGFVVWNLLGLGNSVSPGKAWFTIDDGKTWFADQADKIPPFDHEGKPAVSVVVYTYEGAPQPFAGYLMRYSPEAQAQLNDYRAAVKAGQSQPAVDLGKITVSGMQYKAPGAPANAWVSQSKNFTQVRAIQFPLCPDGKQRPLQEVRP